MDKNKLLGKIKEHGTTLQQFAVQVGISLSAMRRKICEDSQFTRDEIERISNLLNLTDDELLAIFFAD